jgi:hypothetical protein
MRAKVLCISDKDCRPIETGDLVTITQVHMDWPLYCEPLQNCIGKIGHVINTWPKEAGTARFVPCIAVEFDGGDWWNFEPDCVRLVRFKRY